MKRTVTGFFTACFAVMLGIGCCSIPANAKVIEPEVVKTEKWTASYFIDDDMEKLYPYFECQADIYNDGTINCFYWNTHEWDGFDTVTHTVTPAYTMPVCSNTEEYLCASAWINGTEYDGFSFIGFRRRSNTDLTNEAWSSMLGGGGQPVKPETLYEKNIEYLKLSSFPPEYNCSGSTYFSTIIVEPNSGQYSSSPTSQNSFLRPNGWSGTKNKYGPKYTDYEGSLAKFPVNKKWSAVFKPNTDPTGTYTISYLGHDITITPELLSGKVVAEPELTEQEKQIKKLEEENKTLQNKLQSYEAFDTDGDGLLTSADAQMILVYYAEYLAGATSGKTGDYAAFIQTFKGK